MLRLFPFLLTLGTLAACGSLVPGTLARLSTVSPLDSDPSGWLAAVDLPPGVAIPDGGVVLTLGARRTDTGIATTEDFTLDQGVEGAARTYRVALDDLDRLRALQSRIRTWKAIWPDETEGQLSIRVALCQTPPGPRPGARFDVALRTDPDAPLRPLLSGAPVGDALNLLDGATDCSAG